METISSNNLQSLLPVLKTCDFVVLGELHGIQENAQLVNDLLSLTIEASIATTIAFEWLLSESELLSLQNYIHDINPSFEIPNFFYNSDGRVTVSHLELLEKIRKHNSTAEYPIRISAFDSATKNRELNMAKNLLQIYQENGGLIIVDTGSYHAQRFGTQSKRKSLVDILSGNAKCKNVFIKYESGNMELEDHIYNVSDNEMQSTDQTNHFDFSITIPKATAATNEELSFCLKNRIILKK